jgi:N-acetylglucosamine kinase-like BadF-type ATPase
MLRRATGREIPKELAVEQKLFSRVLLDCAADGDPTARRIVADHGASLGDYALVAARKVGLLDSTFPLVLAGGVFRHPSPLLADAMVARTREFARGAQPIRSRFEPVVGALLLAFELAGNTVGDQLLASLEPTLPPASLFET